MKKRIIAFLCIIVIGMGSVSNHVLAMDQELNKTVENSTESPVEGQEPTDIMETESGTEVFETPQMEESKETFEIQESETVIESDLADEEVNDSDLSEDDVEETEEVNEAALSQEEVMETLDMHRLYNPNSGEHFYTSNINERDHLVSVGWNYEGISWKAPVEGEPLYRLYNPNAGDHHYTLNVNERDHLVSVGWNYEGIGWYSDAAKSIPVYRVYNPNAVTGTHHYTANYSEIEHLVSVGWNYEGIGWYSCEGINTGSGNPGNSGSEVVDEYIEIVNVSDEEGTFDVVVHLERNESQIETVYAAVWSCEDQRDIKWYIAEKVDNNRYLATANAINHQWNSGQYEVHVYVQTPEGDMNFVQADSIVLNLPEREQTIGEQKVDMYVNQILNEVNNKLYGSYMWCVNNITYKKLPIPMIPPEGYTEDEYYAVYAYENREGNCYCYAAAFYQLALELGYDAEFIQGKVGMAAGGTGPHAWVEIHVNGGTYVCDPDAQYETGRNAYMVTYASAPFKYYK